MTIPSEVTVNPAPRLNAIVLAVLAIVIGFLAATVVAFPGKADAHPHNAPQLGEFRPLAGSPLFGTFIGPSGELEAEFAAASFVRYNAEIKIVECKNGAFSERVDGKIFTGVGGVTSASNSVRLTGTGGHAQFSQSVTLHVDNVRPGQHFAVRARWIPGGKFMTLASWKDDKPLLCGDLSAQYSDE